MRNWIIGLGIALLSACAVEPVPAPTPESTAESDLTLAVTPQPLAACTPGDSRLCCPYVNGCSCPGTNDCLDNGQWQGCVGAGARGFPCP